MDECSSNMVTELVLSPKRNYLDVPSCLKLASTSKYWLAALECMPYSSAAVAATTALLNACESECEEKRNLNPMYPKRGIPCKILTMESRPALSNFVYGEIGIRSMAQLLAVAELKNGDTFADLGCGGGKQLFVAATLVPGLRALVGYELLTGYLNAARDLLFHFMSRERKHIQLNLIHEDFTNANYQEAWLFADLVFAASTCFDQSQMSRIATIAQFMKPGSRFISLDKPLPPPASSLFSILYICRCTGSWGPTLAYIQQRTHRRRYDEESLFQ